MESPPARSFSRSSCRVQAAVRADYLPQPLREEQAAKVVGGN
jgi:hypothetical protein